MPRQEARLVQPMLKQLFVRNLAVVAEAEIEFGPGLTVVTGETGAGKSLLVDALLLLCGARAESGLIRDGEERAELMAEFRLAEASPARAWLRDAELDDGDACQLRRVLRSEGSSRAWINGRPALLSQLAELAEHLVEIHGQHEHQALLSRRRQLELLDDFAAAAAQRREVEELALRWQELGARMADLGAGEDREARLDLLRHEVEQLDAWALAPAALQQLEAEHRRLANADRLLAACSEVLQLLDDDEQAAGPVLGRAQARLQELLALDESLGEQATMLEEAEIRIAEVVRALDHYAEALEPDPERLARCDQHLAQLHALARRHRVPVAELAVRREEMTADLKRLENADASLAELARQRERCLEAYRSAAAKLTQKRHEAARRLGERVTGMMQELGMAGGRFAADLDEVPDAEPDPQGLERCEFLVSANPGQEPRPLRRVASGGELSRISLALRVAASTNRQAACMVFDEVDSGVGGAVAEVVGRKLRELASSAQVLCVTHLPQVAAQAHAQVSVSKAVARGHTRTLVRRLDREERVAELARMLGGVQITAETEAHARRMLTDGEAR